MTATPIAEPALIAVAVQAGARVRRRAEAAGIELSRPPELVVADEDKARALLIVEATLAHAEAALRAAEPLLDAAPAIDLPATFARAGLLGRSGLAAAALARAEEHALAAALARIAEDEDAAEGPGARRLDPIDGALAAEAFAVRSAEAARLDRAGDPLLPMHDLAAEDRHALYWQVAACLAAATLAVQGEAAVGNEDATHRAAAAAVARTLALVDDADGIAAAAMRHARAIGAGIDDTLIAGTFAAGRIASLAAMLAERAGIGFEEARLMLAAPARAAVLLRACDVARPVAAAMVVALAFALDRGQGGEPDALAAEILDGFERLPVARALIEVRRSRLEPAYRNALAALATS